MKNPFFYGNPVPAELFVNRKYQIRRLVSRILSEGQSSAIVGEPRTGKTSILNLFKIPAVQERLFMFEGTLIFSYVDAQMFDGEIDQSRFWELALSPLQERIFENRNNSNLAKTFQICKENNFGNFVLLRFLEQLKEENWRLVLMIDEFDIILYNPTLNSAEFYGGLRSLASTTRGALALIIASRLSLSDLDVATQKFSRTGSPYFNIFDEITLGPLPLKDVSLLLKLANNRFSLADRYFITNVAGGHPYLVQLAAYELWETHYKGVKDEKERRQLAGEEIYRKASDIISSTWRYWAPTKRQAFTTICLAHMSVLEKGSEMLESRYFNLDELFKGMRDFRQEISQLRLNGFIMEDSSVPGGWRVCPTAFLWWVADEIVRSVRVETTFENWLQKQEWDGLLTKGEKELLKTTMLSFGELVKDGVNTLVEITSTLKK